MRVCWNRQTGTFEGRVSTTYGFKSRHSHQKQGRLNLGVLVSKLNTEMWLSLVERCVRDAEAAGSNPVISTKNPCFPYGIHGFPFIFSSCVVILRAVKEVLHTFWVQALHL